MLPTARFGACEVGAELGVVALRDPEEVGDHEHRERARELADELAVAGVDELVELAVGEAPHERLVLAEPLRA